MSHPPLLLFPPSHADGPHPNILRSTDLGPVRRDKEREQELEWENLEWKACRVELEFLEFLELGEENDGKLGELEGWGELEGGDGDEEVLECLEWDNSQ